jgi:hypothetical protein
MSPFLRDFYPPTAKSSNQNHNTTMLSPPKTLPSSTSWIRFQGGVITRPRNGPLLFIVIVLGNLLYLVRQSGWVQSRTLPRPNSSRIHPNDVYGVRPRRSPPVDPAIVSVDFDAIQFIFPSNEDRLYYYMGSWYIRTLEEEEKGQDNAFLCSVATYYRPEAMHFFDKPYMFDETNLKVVRNKNRPFHFGARKNNKAMLVYSQDALENLIRHGPPGMRLILQFGDQVTMPTFPLILKSRWASNQTIAVSSSSSSSTTTTPAITQPILALLETGRHYRNIPKVKRLDIPWQSKKDSLIWRGFPTGGTNRLTLVQKYIEYPVGDIDMAFDSLSDEVLADDPQHNIVLQRGRVELQEQLQFKYLLSLEGNDVASGLKWMLYSNSVVLMPRPTRVAWAMEDQLVPWYHYIPVQDDLSDLPAMIQWARANDEICERIAQHASEYIIQLYASKEARRNNKWLHQQIVKRYTAQFGKALANCSIE